MHRPEIVHRVELLLASEALSLRGIADLIGISRGSVATIKAGRHHHQRLPPSDDSDDSDSLAVDSGVIDRCPTCGGKVRMPCVACRCRALPKPVRKAAEAIQREEIKPLGLELVGEARRRYERIRADKGLGDLNARLLGVQAERRRQLPRRSPAPNQLSLFDRDPPPWELDDADQSEDAA